MKYKILLVIVISVLFSLSFKGIQSDKSPFERYSTVKVFINSFEDIKTLQLNDIDVEHFRGSINEGITIVINQNELAKLKNTGL